MTQNLHDANGAGERYLRHGIAGYIGAETSHAATLTPDALAQALQTRIPVASKLTPGCILAATGSVCELATRGSVAISGQPYFGDEELAEVAHAAGDAAALARGYGEHGDGIFARIHGSFCCAIIDQAAQRTLLAIDRLGQYSMFYRASASALSFGSCANAALECDHGTRTLANQGIYNYLYFHMVPCPQSVYSNLEKLQASHYLEYSEGQWAVHNYWLPSFSENLSASSPQDLAAALKTTLRSAVKNCSTTGKVGAFLSGGLDSSTVTGVLAELSEGQAEAYSIGFSAEGYDEMAFARITAGHFGVKLHEYYVTPQDVVDALPLIATSYDEPFGNSSALPAYFCAKMAAENGVQTLLAGDGGDELFGGNERYLKQTVFEHYKKVPAIMRNGLLEPLLRALPANLPLVSKANSYVAQANTPLPDRLQSYNFLHRHAASEIFSGEFLAEVDTALPLEILRDIYKRPEPATDLNRMLYLDWQITLADNDLRKVSQMCALAGVNVVYPLLDDALVEFSCRVPSALKIKGQDLRHFFKDALRDWLPQETINKSKQGFGLPFGVWMQTYQPLREMAYDSLIKLKDRDFIRADFIDKTIEMHQSHHAAYYGELVWLFTVFELWMDAHSSP